MLKPGYILGNRYKVIKALGQGGQSNVYLLKDMRLKQKKWVAKEMTAQYTDPRAQALAKKHFEQEANMLATLDHPNLPKVIDYFSQGGKHYLVMKYLEGEDLGLKLRRAKKPFPEEQVARWFIQVATVLYYLHRQPQPIIFRDIKPSNIMITEGQVKLIDFGIARHFNPAKKGDTLRIGSPGYSPPEQYSGQTDPRSDIYSVGITMHHMLTLQDPARTQTPFKLPPIKVYNREVSSKMIYIVEKATQIEQDKRYQNALELKNDLKSLIGEPLTRPTSPTMISTIPNAPVSATVPTPPPSGMTQPAPPPHAPATSFMPGLTVPAPQPVAPAAQSAPSAVKDEKEAGQANPAPSKKKKAGFVIPLIFLLVIGTLGYLGYANKDLILKYLPIHNSPISGPTPQPGSAYERGLAGYNRGDYREAAVELIKARQENPGDPEILLYLTRAYAAVSGKPSLSLGVILPPPPDKPGKPDKKEKDGFDPSREFLSGVILSLRKMNFEGGAHGKNMDIKIARLTGKKAEDTALIEGLIDSRPLAILGFAEKNQLSSASKKAAKKDIPLITAGRFFNGEEEKDLIQWGVSTERQILALSRLLIARKPGRVFLVYDSEGFDTQFEKLGEGLKDSPVKIEKSFTFKSDKPNFEPIIEVMGSSKPDAVVFLGHESSAGYFINSLHKNRLETSIFLPPYLTTETLVEDAGTDGKNIVGLSSFYRDTANYRGAYFAGLFRDTFSREPSLVSARGYDLANLLFYAAGKSFPEPDRIKSFLTGADSGAGFTGVTGYYGQEKDNPFWWAVVESSGGKWKETGGFQF